MPVLVKKKLSGSVGCSTSSRRRCSHPWCPEALIGRASLLHVRLKREDQWKHFQAIPSSCPRRSHPRRKFPSCNWCGDSNMKKGGLFGMVGSGRGRKVICDADCLGGSRNQHRFLVCKLNISPFVKACAFMNRLCL